jgi:hypothetical protein
MIHTSECLTLTHTVPSSITVYWDKGHSSPQDITNKHMCMNYHKWCFMYGSVFEMKIEKYQGMI